MVLLWLTGCSPSPAQISQDWTTYQNELRDLINQVEALKADLPAAWTADVTSQAGLSSLTNKDGQVQPNLSARAKLLKDAQPVLTRLEKLNPEHLSDRQEQLTAELADYLAREETGLNEEKAFFELLSSGQYDDDALLAQLAKIDANRSAQRTAQPAVEPSQAEPPVKPDSAEPAETPESDAAPESNEPAAQTIPKADARYRLNQASQLFEPISDAPAKAVLLTFDDIPITGDAKQSLAIARVLKERDIPAIFFVYGAYLNSQVGRDTVKELHDMGFALGNHTQNHPDLTQLSADGVREEIRLLNDQLEELTGQRPKYFRPPYGITNPDVSAIAREEGMLPMNWTYGYDWENDYQAASALAKIMVESPMLTPGANLLMHDRTNTAQAIEQIVTGLADKGYHFIDPEEISHD